MNAEAVIMMLVAMTILWGGLVLAIVRLNRHDLPSAEEVRRDL
jgi:hypothetical protein